MVFCLKCNLSLFLISLTVVILLLLKTCLVSLIVTRLTLSALLLSKCMIVWKFIRKVDLQLHSREQLLKNNMKHLIILLLLGLACFAFQACNVTRTVTTEAATYQRGDTTVHITTRTIETYDASKKLY